MNFVFKIMKFAANQDRCQLREAGAGVLDPDLDLLDLDLLENKCFCWGNERKMIVFSNEKVMISAGPREDLPHLERRGGIEHDEFCIKND